MNKKKYILTFLAILLLVGFKFIYPMFKEFQEKKELAIMQTVEFDNSHLNWRIIRQPMGTSLVLLGIKTKDINNPYVWISLNSKREVKYIPQKIKFYLICSDIEEIQKWHEIEDNVLKFLTSNCQ